MTPRVLHLPLAVGDQTLNDEASHHLISVLRLKAGDTLTLFNGRGLEGKARVVRADRLATQVHVDAVEEVRRESPVHTTVVQALCTGDKMDWVVQKSTELGAARIIGLAAERSVLKLDAMRAEKRRLHWQSIAESAAAQCGRNNVPEVLPVMRLADVIAHWEACAAPKTGWLLDPFATVPLSQANMEGNVMLMIGPEAGWSDPEETQLHRAGFIGVACGPRILRTETAAAVVLSAIAVRCGEF
jgi:16S rRNA (uracil1498-N3)-methyltransferase